MYLKTKLQKLALGIATLITSLAMVTPQSIFADDVVIDDTTTATVEFEPGALTLVTVPTFNFGMQNIAATTQSYSATSSTNSIQISDLRGSKSGWDLNVSLSSFTLSDNTTTSIEGAYIEIKDATISAVNGTIGEKPTTNPTLRIDSDGSETDILRAVDGTGDGLWMMSWNASDASLTILPGTVKAGVNTATLNWSLLSTP